MRWLIAALTIVGLVAACGTASTSTASPSPSASPSALVSLSPSPSPTPGPTPLASPTPPAGFICTDAAGGSVSDSPVAAIRVGQHPGYDRFVIEFGGGIPSYSVTRQQSATFIRSPKGDQVTLEGNAGVAITLHSVTNWGASPGPKSFLPHYPYLREAMLVQDYEGYQTWALGIQGTPCLRVFTLTSPSRLVVDIAAV
jgi:hypothetical protein